MPKYLAEDSNTTAPRTALISGAGFAGLASAWWLHRLGYSVTVVESAQGLRRGGTPVDIREGVVEVVRRMGLLDAIVTASLPPRPTTFLRADGAPLTSPAAEGALSQNDEQGWEIERDLLLNLLFDRVRNDVELLFGDSVTDVNESDEGVDITLASGGQRSVSLLLGCDGTHSTVRRLCFGEEASFVYFLRNYFSLTIVDKLLLPENTAQMLSTPGKTIMVNAYNGKTDIAFCFHSEEPISYDRRDRAQQKRSIRARFEGQGWRAPELLQEMEGSDNFYFDQLCQIRMPLWTHGRVALVGDAGYCPSPAAGMGGSMALLGAAALADALEAHPSDLQQAFREYDRTLRPVVDEVQANAVEFGMKMFLPASEDEIAARNAMLNLS